MPDLHFQVESAQAVPYAATPTLALKLRIRDAERSQDASPVIHTISLHCQVRIESTRRQYSPDEQDHLRDLFGEPMRWAQTLRSLLWTHVNVIVPRFSGAATVDLQLPCSFDFNLAATKYFDALEHGDIPLCLLFSGTMFYEGPDGALQVAQIPWEKETAYRLPASAWKDMMAHYYPNTAWLCLRKDMFDRLHEYKSRNSLPTWEQAFERLLELENEDPAEEVGQHT